MVEWDPLGGNLIFLIAPPRSGTTLLQKVIASHSAVHTLSEPWIAMQPLLALRPRAFSAFYRADVARDAMVEFLSSLPEGADAYWEAVRRMLGHLYERALAHSGKRVFLDKTPRYFHIVPELRTVFPRARYLWMARNPLAVFSSVLESWVNAETPGALHGFGADLLLGPRLVQEARQSGAGVFLRYEELVAAPEETLRRVCQSIGLEYEAAMPEYGASSVGADRFFHGDKYTVYEKTRPEPDRVERWRGVLGASPVWTNWAHGYLDQLGCELVALMGYDFGALRQLLGPRPQVEVPWEQAIAP